MRRSLKELVEAFPLQPPMWRPCQRQYRQPFCVQPLGLLCPVAPTTELAGEWIQLTFRYAKASEFGWRFRHRAYDRTHGDQTANSQSVARSVVLSLIREPVEVEAQQPSFVSLSRCRRVTRL